MNISNYSFLYVEDDPLSREALDLIMRRVMNVERLTIFEDSKDFLSRVKALSPKPDMILLDIHMAPLNGFDLIKLLREDAEFKDVLVVALTASVMNEEVDLLKKVGFNGVIGKPFQVTLFPKLLESIVRGDSIWHIADAP